MDGGSDAVAQVARCLSCLLATDNNVRKAAEQQLQNAVQHRGFASTLAALATNGALTNNDVDMRQQAALLLKQIIKTHWSADAPKFEEPELSRDERAHIQATLPAGLADPSSKIRTAVAMCIVAVAKTDPDGWPGLIENLVGAIHAQSGVSTPLVHGAIRCLSLLSDDIDEQQLPQVAQALLPELLKVATAAAAAATAGGDAAAGSAASASGAAASAATAAATANLELAAGAVSILHDVLRSLGVMAGVYQRQVRDLLVPLVEPWLPLLCGVVAQPLHAEDASGWALRMQCLKSLTQLVSSFSRPLATHIGGVMGVAWRMYTACLGQYQLHLVLEPAEGGRADAEDEGCGLPSGVDAEGNTLDLEALIAQLFELLMALLGLPRYAKLIRPALPEMTHLGVGYMQMTARQAGEWLCDASVYVADEEDSTFTVRVSGELLADSVVQAFGMEGAGALMDAVERRMAEAEAARAAGQAGWWKLREAALLAAGTAATAFNEIGADGGEAGGGGGGSARRRAAAATLRGRLQGVVDELLRNDLQDPGLPPLLVGRAMWLAARLQPHLRPDQRRQLMLAAAAGLTSNLPAPVKIGACRALASLAPRVPPASLPPGTSEALFGGLLGLLGASGEESLNLVLECAVPLVQADPAAALRALPALSGPVLQVWSRHVSDPLIGPSALELLGALARLPGAGAALAQQVLPSLAELVRRPEAQPPGLLEGCLELLSQLVRGGGPPAAAAVAGSLLGPLLALLPGGAAEGADDESGALAHGATELVVELLRAGREDLLSWAGPSLSSPSPSTPAPAPASPDAVFSALLSAAHRLLDPARDEYRTCLAGDLASALLACLPSRAAVQPVLGGLLGACAAKLVRSNLAPLVGGLLGALAGMVLAGGAAGWVEALEALRLEPPGGGPPVSGLRAVLPLMLERHGDVRGRRSVRAVALALSEVLRSRHPLLLAFSVRGKRNDLSSGVRTRRQAAAGGGEGWSSVPAGVRLAAVLAELAVEQPWAAEGEEGEEGELDDVFGGEADTEEEEEEGEEGEGSDAEEDLEDDAGGASTTPGGGLNLSLEGRGINQREQASLDAHIDRSRTLPADSAVVAGYGGADPSASAAAAAASATPASDPNADPLLSLDLRTHLLDTLRPLRASADTAPLLAAALDLLPGRRQQTALALLAGEGGAKGQ